jgi:hypothetical protein
MTTRFALFLSLTVVGCVTPAAQTSALDAAKIRKAREFFPLTIGTGWQYEASMLGEKRVFSVTVLKVVDGVAEDSAGAKLLADAYGVRDQRRYLLRDPVETGTKWTNVVSPSSIESYEIVAADQPCDVPAGTYAGCVVIESRNRIDQARSLVNEMTVAPGVGIVRLTTTLEDQGKRIPQSQLVLLKFTAPSTR